MNRFSITLLLLFVLTFGCQSEELPKPHEDMQEQPNPPLLPLTYLALGDSYTIGEGVSPAERYPEQLKDSLQKAGIGLGAVTILARTGWTTDELSRAMDAAEFFPPYDMVSLLIGVNNQYRGRSPENFRGEFVGLLQRAISLAGDHADRVVVISIPDWGVTPFAQGRDREQIAREIDAYNAVKKEETLRLGVAWVDVTPISRRADQQPELLALDGLHPSGLMYRLWMREIFPIALQILTQQNDHE